MKKIALYALAALAIAGCAKEVEAPVELNLRTRTVTIRAGFDSETKTAYDASGKFSWVAGDKIVVLVTNGETTKQVTFITEKSGDYVDFSGQVEEGYELAGLASYPFTGEMDGYACNDLAWDQEKDGWRLWGSIKPDHSRPLASLPLIGKADPTSKGSYQFKTATGIVKFTVQNVPLEAVCAYLEIPADKKESANLNGWYKLSDDGVILMENAVLRAPKGFHVAAGSSLTIYSNVWRSASNATITIASPPANCAAIGGNSGESGGTITIYDGNFSITAGDYATGIGGGKNGGAGNVTIGGGTFTIGAAPCNFSTAIGTGAVICLASDLIPIDRSNWYVPAWCI